jgi:hypothetical protein
MLLSALAVSRSTGLPNGRTDPENPSGFYGRCAENGWYLRNPTALVMRHRRFACKHCAELASGDWEPPISD